MKNEYLFLTDEHRATVETYKPNGIVIEIFGIANTTLWTAKYSLHNNNEDCADKLSNVHSVIIKYSPLVLSCESSEYYNKILFPLVNELERKLRKLLYLAVSISDNSKAKESIKQLEEKDFGNIFDLLFTDQDFINNLRNRIIPNKESEYYGKNKYSKVEIKAYLDLLVENTLWDTILGNNSVPTLRTSFRDVQKFRNDVMHAHNIDKVLFGKSKNLFSIINKELDVAISKIILNIENQESKTKAGVNEAILSAITATNFTGFEKVLKSLQLLAIQPVLEEAIKNPQLLGGIAPEQMNEALRSIEQFQISMQILSHNILNSIDYFKISNDKQNTDQEKSKEEPSHEQ